MTTVHRPARRLTWKWLPRGALRYWGVDRMPSGAVWIGLGPILWVRWRGRP